MFHVTGITAGGYAADLVDFQLPATGVSLEAIGDFLRGLQPPAVSERGVVLNNSIPRWLYMYLVLHYAAAGAPWLGCWESGLGNRVVVINSPSGDPALGAVLGPVV